jgi:NADPH:quinone reductase-like Zn-dependent oxidoreductase
MTYAEAAAVPTGGLEALVFLRQGGIQSEQKVLINGAGGTIGTFAVQLAKHFGARVAAVDGPTKLEMLRSIGAHQVFDYTQGDFTRSGDRFDLIVDLVGKSTFAGSMRSLRSGGCYLIANPGISQRFRKLWASMTSSQRVRFAEAQPRTEDLIFLKELIDAGKITSVIDRCYPLEEVAEAHRYVETGRKKGHVVVTVNKDRALGGEP